MKQRKAFVVKHKDSELVSSRLAELKTKQKEVNQSLYSGQVCQLLYRLKSIPSNQSSQTGHVKKVSYIILGIIAYYQ